ncbi:MAG: histidine kinase [Nocardioidaceae bacterium]
MATEHGRRQRTPTGVTALLRPQPFEPGEDPDRAPGSHCGEDAARPWTFWRAVQNRLWMYLLGLVFIGLALPSMFGDVVSRADAAYRIGCLIAICLLYAGSAVIADASLRVRWLYLGLFLAVLAATIPFTGWYVFTIGVYVSVMIACLIPWRQARWALLGWGLLNLVAALVVLSWLIFALAFLGLFFGLGTGGGAESGRLAERLNRSQQRNAVLAVAAERERIARDLHDILGHSLTAIAIKSDLAHRLVDRDPVAAKAQLGEIEQVARQALADVRTTASGIRRVRVAVEIASARSVLLAAGIQASVPTTIAPMSDRASETLGFVVREAITNAIRHAHATNVTITTGSTWVQIDDDGVGLGHGRGSGLAGLRERVGAAHGTLSATSGPGGGTTVRADLPADPTDVEVTTDAGSPADVPIDPPADSPPDSPSDSSGSGAPRGGEVVTA